MKSVPVSSSTIVAQEVFWHSVPRAESSALGHLSWQLPFEPTARPFLWAPPGVSQCWHGWHLESEKSLLRGAVLALQDVGQHPWPASSITRCQQHPPGSCDNQKCSRPVKNLPRDQNHPQLRMVQPQVPSYPVWCHWTSGLSTGCPQVHAEEPARVACACTSLLCSTSSVSCSEQKGALHHLLPLPPVSETGPSSCHTFSQRSPVVFQLT